MLGIQPVIDKLRSHENANLDVYGQTLMYQWNHHSTDKSVNW